MAWEGFPCILKVHRIVPDRGRERDHETTVLAFFMSSFSVGRAGTYSEKQSPNTVGIKGVTSQKV